MPETKLQTPTSTFQGGVEGGLGQGPVRGALSQQLLHFLSCERCTNTFADEKLKPPRLRPESPNPPVSPKPDLPPRRRRGIFTSFSIYLCKVPIEIISYYHVH